MTEIAFLPEDAKQRWRDLTHAMAIMGLGHLARLYGQLEGYIMALLDFGRVTAPQGKQLLKAAADLFAQCRSEYLKHKQKPRRQIAGAVGDRIRQSQRRSEGVC
jgi:polyhydroxyalkanoate synthesis regulator phasin